MQLSGQQRKQLQEALIDAFPNIASLEQMLVFELEKNLRVIAGEGSLQDTVFKLIETASSEGWIANLIRAAYNYKPGNSKLQNLVQNLNIQIYNQIDISSLQIKNRSLEDRVNQLQKEFRDFQERYDKNFLPFLVEWVNYHYT